MVGFKGFKRFSLAVALLLVVSQLLLTGCTPAATPTAAPTAAPTKGVAATATAVPVNMDAFKGKTIVLIVPHGAGGGFDAYARLIAPYIEKYSGATLNIKNVTVAGGMGGRNDMWAAPKDGFTIGFSSFSDMVLAQMAGMEGVTYDAPMYTFLQLVTNEPRVVFTGKDSKYKTVADFSKPGTKLKFSSPGVGDGDFFITVVLAQALGWDLTTIAGYQNNADAGLAVVKGEVDGRESSLSSMAAMLKSGDVIPLLMVNPTRVPEYPNIPTALELAKDDATRNFLSVATVIYQIDRVFFGPPGMDAANTAAWRAILDKVMKDPELLAGAAKQSRPIVTMPGAEVQSKVGDVAKTAQTIAPMLKAAVAAAK
jgi:tripartite-type tricarboxylate transporter receptor subunit TctC